MPYYNRDPKRDHNFDNHPYRDSRFRACIRVHIKGFIYNYTVNVIQVLQCVVPKASLSYKDL